MFQAPKLTNGGKELYYENMGGAKLQITTIQLGSGRLTGPISSMTALVEPVAVIEASTSNNGGQYVDVSGGFSNSGRTEGFYWREIGVFAADPDHPDDRSRDILYCYQNAYDTADLIPAASVETVEKVITVPIVVGDAETVICTLSGSLVYASKKDLEEHAGSEKAHMDIREELRRKADLGADGKLVAEQLGDIDCGYFDEGGADPVALHNASPGAHALLEVDGNGTQASAGAASLEEHMADPWAHQNIDLDGNMN